MTAGIRLQRFLAAAGVAARRKCEQLITEGRVSVNGKVAKVLGTKIDPDRDSVTVDGQAVAALDHFYVLLNKPKGCITAVSDDRGRPTVMDYLPNCPVPVKPVGRLDFYTEGVLLLTNDGELAARLLSSSHHVPKTYHAKVHGRLSRDDLKALRSGMQLDDGTQTQSAEVALLPSDSKHSWVAITLYEGKHRQIHRMLEALGFRVDKLQRVAFANLTFHHLRVGDARELTQLELNALRDAVGLDHRAVARGRWKATREATDIPRRARAKARAEAAVLEAPGNVDDESGFSAAAPQSGRRSDERGFVPATGHRGRGHDQRSLAPATGRRGRRDNERGFAAASPPRGRRDDERTFAASPPRRGRGDDERRFAGPPRRAGRRASPSQGRATGGHAAAAAGR